MRFAKYSPDGKTIVLATKGTRIILWDSISREKINKSFKGHRFAVNFIVFNNTGTKMASGSGDNKVFIWDIVSQLGTL